MEPIRAGSGGNYVVVGPPGTGKTTFLAAKTRDFIGWAQGKWEHGWQNAVLICSLTRAASAEIAGRDLPIPASNVSTLHGHAYRALDRPPVAEGMIREFNEAHPTMALSGAKVDPDEPAWDRNDNCPGDRLSEEYHVLRARMVERSVWPTHVLAFAEAWESWKADLGCIDFSDMIEQAYKRVPYPPSAPSIIIGDEAQDWSLLEYRLARKWGDAAGHFIIAGDSDQAIYTWRGADPDIFLDPTIPEKNRRTLGQSYRLPRAVHAAAMKWRERLSNPQPVNYAPRDAAGEVVTCPACWKAPRTAVYLAQKYLDAGKTVMFLASCNFLIAPTVAELRKRAIPFGNPWRRSRGDWNPLSRGRGTSMADRIGALLRVDPLSYDDDRMWTWAEFHNWTNVLKANGCFQHGMKGKAELRREDNWLCEWDEIAKYLDPDALADFVTRLGRALEEGADPKAVRTGLLDWWHGHMLAAKAKTAEFPIKVAKEHGVQALTEEPRCYVGSIHSFKGAEADVVFVYPDLSPAGWREWGTGKGRWRDAVVRQFYVAITRARESLVLCNGIGRCIPLTEVMN